MFVLLAGMAVCCGGNPVAPPPLPPLGGSTPVAPPPPPPPFIGDWSGLLDISYVFPLTGETTHDLCDHQWTVQSQAGTTFSGAFRSGGGTAQFPRRESCIDSGTFS